MLPTTVFFFICRILSIKLVIVIRSTFCVSVTCMNVTCTTDYLQVDFLRNQIPGVDEFDLSFVDLSCKASGNETHISLNTKLNECGTTYQVGYLR